MEKIQKGNELRQHHVNRKQKYSSNSTLKVGDIVLIKGEDNVPRTQWRIRRIRKLFIGNDEKVRGAELAVVSKTGEKTFCQRPLQKLIPFEIVDDNENTDDKYKDNDRRADETHINNDRILTRKAKEEGQCLRRLRDKYG